MHRIDTPTAQQDKFGQGKNGFTNGDPATGRRATDLNSDMWDAVQEEICTTIEEAGITLDKSKHNQLSQAIKKAISDGGFLVINENLSDVADVAKARQNLQLGTAATKDAGTASGQLIPVGGFGLGLESSPSISIDFTSYIFRAGEVLKLNLATCQNVPSFLGKTENMYLQCIGVRSQEYGCGILFSTYQKPEVSFIGHRLNNKDGQWNFIKLGNAGDFAKYLPLSGGTITGNLNVNGETALKNSLKLAGTGKASNGEVRSPGQLLQPYGTPNMRVELYAVDLVNDHFEYRIVVVKDGVGTQYFTFREDGGFVLPGYINASGNVTAWDIKANGGVYDGGERVYSRKNPPSSANLSQNGWHRDNVTGMIRQWGRADSSGGERHVFFPTAFPSACYSIQLTAGTSSNITASYFNDTTTGFDFALNGGSGAYSLSWEAIGK